MSDLSFIALNQIPGEDRETSKELQTRRKPDTEWEMHPRTREG